MEVLYRQKMEYEEYQPDTAKVICLYFCQKNWRHKQFAMASSSFNHTITETHGTLVIISVEAIRFNG